MSSTNEEFCYNGELKEEWDQHVQQLNHLHDVIYPSVLEKGTRGEWKRVHPDFPDVAGVAATELFPGYKAFEFVKKHQDKINPEKANRQEKSALDVVQTTQKFMDICVNRVKIHGLYSTLINELTELTTKGHNSSVVLLKLKYLRTKEERLEDEIMKRFRDFEKIKTKVLGTLKLFKNAYSCLAAEEGLAFDKRFNRNPYHPSSNPYINYWKFEEEYRIHGETMEVYLQHQETLWIDALSFLAEKPAQAQRKRTLSHHAMETRADRKKRKNAEQESEARREELWLMKIFSGQMEETLKEAQDYLDQIKEE